MPYYICKCECWSESQQNLPESYIDIDSGRVDLLADAGKPGAESLTQWLRVLKPELDSVVDGRVISFGNIQSVILGQMWPVWAKNAVNCGRANSVLAGQLADCDGISIKGLCNHDDQLPGTLHSS